MISDRCKIMMLKLTVCLLQEAENVDFSTESMAVLTALFEHSAISGLLPENTRLQSIVGDVAVS